MPWLLRRRRTCTLCGQLDQELRIALEMMDGGGLAAGERAHLLDALPIGDGHELGLVLAILAEGLDAQGLPISGSMPAS